MIENRNCIVLAEFSLVLVTAIIPVFNRARTVARAIESVLAQDLPPNYHSELIVVDDGSTDEIDSVLRAFGGRIRYVRHERNSGAAAARNTGVSIAADGLVAFLDSDDIWLPGKLHRQIETMVARRWPASCTAYRLLRQGREALVSPRAATGSLSLGDLAWGCYVSPGSTLVADKSLFATVGSLDTTMRRLEDWDWLLRYAQSNELGFIGEPLAEVDPSRASQVAVVREAVARMKDKHLGHLSSRDRRHMLAGLELTSGSACFGQREYLAAIAHVLRSVWHVPIGNKALAAVLHNMVA